jgi:formylglycine-generating enzyme required for sulfatase activity
MTFNLRMLLDGMTFGCSVFKRIPPIKGFIVVAILAALVGYPNHSLAVEEQGTAKPGQRLSGCPQCPPLMVIAPGVYTMTEKGASDGRTVDDPEGVPKSARARQVKIDAAFAVGVYDVTRAEYAIFVKETHYEDGGGCFIWQHDAWTDDRTKSWRDPGFRQGPDDPVVCVSWQDAQAYLAWLNTKASDEKRGTRLGPYRLPTWEEAEYSAGGGAKTAYYWGDAPNRNQANYGADKCFPCQPFNDGRDRWLYTSPVGSFPPNSFGLYDEAGNVSQLTANCVRTSPSGLIWDPPSPLDQCRLIASRGGSWLLNPEYLQTGQYALIPRINRNQATGFRVARTLSSGTF